MSRYVVLDPDNEPIASISNVAEVEHDSYGLSFLDEDEQVLYFIKEQYWHSYRLDDDEEEEYEDEAETAALTTILDEQVFNGVIESLDTAREAWAKGVTPTWTAPPTGIPSPVDPMPPVESSPNEPTP